MSCRLNLLPVEEQRQAILKPAVRRWVIVAVCCVILNAALAALRMSEHHELVKLETAGRTAAERTRKVMTALTDIDGRIEALQGQLTALQHLQPTPDPLRCVRAIHNAVDEGEQSLLMSTLHISHEKMSELTAGDKQNQTDVPPADLEWCRTTLHLTGRAASELMTARFVNGLRESGEFNAVQLKSTKPTVQDFRFSREFVVECVRREGQP